MVGRPLRSLRKALALAVGAAVFTNLLLAQHVCGWCSRQDEGDCFIAIRAGGEPSESTQHSRGIKFVHQPDGSRPDEESFGHIAAVPDAGQGLAELLFSVGSKQNSQAKLHESGLFSAARLHIGGNPEHGHADEPFVLQVEGDGGIVIRSAQDKAWSLSTGEKPSGLTIAENGIRIMRLASGAPKDSFVLSQEGNLGIGTPWPTVKLDVNGGVQGTSAYSSASDKRYKTNIAKLSPETCLEQIVRLKPVSFEWDRQNYPHKNFQAGRTIGLIAQQVEKVVPEVVLQDSESYRSVQYAALTPILIGAVKSLSLQVKELEAQLETIKASLHLNQAEKL